MFLQGERRYRRAWVEISCDDAGVETHREFSELKTAHKAAEVRASKRMTELD